MGIILRYAKALRSPCGHIKCRCRGVVVEPRFEPPRGSTLNLT